jgi:hypothetical protein
MLGLSSLTRLKINVKLDIWGSGTSYETYFTAEDGEINLINCYLKTIMPEISILKKNVQKGPTVSC